MPKEYPRGWPASFGWDDAIKAAADVALARHAKHLKAAEKSDTPTIERMLAKQAHSIADAIRRLK